MTTHQSGCEAAYWFSTVHYIILHSFIYLFNNLIITILSCHALVIQNYFWCHCNSISSSILSKKLFPCTSLRFVPTLPVPCEKELLWPTHAVINSLPHWYPEMSGFIFKHYLCWCVDNFQPNLAAFHCFSGIKMWHQLFVWSAMML